MPTDSLEITLELTPNPNTLKYALNRDIFAHGSVFYRTADEATQAPLALKLFALDGINSVFIGQNFVTIGLAAKDNLRALNKQVMETIRLHLDSGEPVAQPKVAGADANEDPTSATIRRIIDEEIRPAVARDGGDILFERYEDGVVFLHLQGACSGCPSSTMTLKMGIEARLREEVPEIQDVLAVT